MTKESLKWYQKPVSITASLVLFFPLGLFLMWKYTKWNNKVKWVITGIFALLLISGAYSNKNQANDTQATVSTNVTLMPSPKTPTTLEDKIKAQLGDKETVSIEDATDLNTNQPVPGKKQIDITMNLDGDFWDINSAKERVWARTARLTQTLFSLDSSIYSLQLTANAPITDAYGKKSMTELVLLTVTRATYEKIGWDNFDYKNIPTVADTYYENKNIK